jgi:hypothetical protein
MKKKKKRYFVYIDRKKDDNKIFYIGKGTEDRIKHHRRNKKYNNIFHKHGVIREIFEVETNKISLLFEKYLIAKHHTFVDDCLCDEYACNFTTGGKEAEFSEETREKQRRSALRRGPMPQKTRDKLREIALNQQPFTPEHCENIRKSALHKKKHTQESIDRQKEKLSKKVVQLNLDLIEKARFNSVKEASQLTGINGNSISKCCRGKYSRAGGSIWKFALDVDTQKECYNKLCQIK